MDNNIFSLQNISIKNILSLVEQDRIAIPEIQRPFVWKKSKIRDLIDSLYRGYPVGYIITWESDSAILKGGGKSYGKAILIDGQQRITALCAALAGKDIVNKKYQRENVAISFNPIEEKFETKTRATERGSEWVSDIRTIIASDFSDRKFIREYEKKNPHLTDDDLDVIASRILKIKGLLNIQIGRIELQNNVDIETVNEIFNRINSSGVPLSSADFAMSRIAAYEKEVGDKFGMNLRKTIDYFAEMSLDKSGELRKNIEINDPIFAQTETFSKITWIGNQDFQHIYTLGYNDILLVSSLAEFRRGDLSDLVSLLSGRDFEERNYKAEIKDASFNKLRNIVSLITDRYMLEGFIQDVLIASGYINSDFIRAQNTVNYLYAIYLRLRKSGKKSAEISRDLRKLLNISNLTRRLSSSFNTIIQEDVKKIDEQGLSQFVQNLEETLLSESFWNNQLVAEFDKTNLSTQYWYTYLVAQQKLRKQSFLNKSILTGETLLEDIHHIFPRAYLRDSGFTQNDWNKIANFTPLKRDTNIAVSNKSPKEYLSLITNGEGNLISSDIANKNELIENLKHNAIPEIAISGQSDNYKEFLIERQKLMAKMVREYYESL
jgi:uncharacterized protein with ParB-like and HNH nuclease domain